MTSGNKTVNSKKKYNILQILGGVACALFCVAWLGGCVLFGASMCSFHEEKNPDSDEYVGVWAAYMVKVDDKKFYANSIDEVNDYLVLYENSSAQEVIFLASASEPKIIECSWQRTTENKKEGTEAGILLLGKEPSFSKPYHYFLSGEEGKAYLIDTPLIGGFLCIDYGYRKVYMEKISNDPYDKPWLAE